MEKSKKEKGLSRLFEIAGQRKGLLILAGLLAAGSALPLGYLNNTSTGAIKKTMDQNIEKIEGFIAHTIPDLVNVMATVVVMLVIFFSLDVWLTVVCLAVVVLSLFLQFSNFMGKRAREFMGIYYDTQEKMSASAVQYVRGMPVVKIFGQSVRSFRNHFWLEIINRHWCTCA